MERQVIPIMNEIEEYLIKHKWKKVEGRFKDPKTGKFYVASHAVIVQQTYDEEVEVKLQRKMAVQNERDAVAYSKWSMWDHDVDEMFPPGPVKKKKRRKP